MFEFEEKLVKGNLPGEQLLIYLLESKEEYDEIKEFINKYNIEPSNLLLPQTIAAIDNELSINEKLFLQLLNFYDLVKFYSFILYNDERIFTDKIKSILTSNRTILNSSILLGKEKLSNMLFDKEGGLNELLENNISLLSLYIFSLLVSISS